MTNNQWPNQDLEFLENCPVCSSKEHDVLYEDLTDRLFNNPGLWKYHSCKDCGCAYLNPRPNKESIGRAYDNYYTHQEQSISSSGFRSAIRNDYLNKRFGYSLKPRFFLGYFAMYLLPPPLRQEWDYFARHLKKPATSKFKLLDVGCGNGTFLLSAKSAGWDVYGLEFDENAANIGREKGLNIWTGEFEKAPIERGKFDVITLAHVIEHVHEPAKLIQIISGWLKPGGTLWIATPNLGGISHTKYRSNWYPLQPPHHLILHTGKSLEKLLIENNFTIEQRPRGFYEARIAALSETLAQGANTDSEVRCNYKNNLGMARTLVAEYHVFLNQNLSSEIIFSANKSR